MVLAPAAWPVFGGIARSARGVLWHR